MKINGISFPHPVLGLSNDIQALYDVVRSDTKITDEGILEISLIHKLSDGSSVEQLISEDSARFCVEVQCKKTFFRTAFESKDKVQTISIPVNYVHGQIELQVFVVATKDIMKYSPHDAHKDYEGVSFLVHKGDVLAHGLTEKIFIERSGNGISSMIKVDEDKDRESGPCKINLGSEEIWVYLPASEFKRFQQVSRSQLVAFLHREISMIALIEAVRVILHRRTQERSGSSALSDDGDQDYSECKWFLSLADAIDAKYPDQHIDTESAYSIAQELLENPLLASIKQIEDHDNSM